MPFEDLSCVSEVTIKKEIPNVMLKLTFFLRILIFQKSKRHFSYLHGVNTFGASHVLEHEILSHLTQKAELSVANVLKDQWTKPIRDHLKQLKRSFFSIAGVLGEDTKFFSDIS